ncbi:MAG TPA: dihydrodipicolinate synthase family protein [Paludibaculum sp.]|jgi:4-hydroxy-tetrahydrodipicolinate synthase
MGELPRGIVPVLQTPFDTGGAIDYESLARLIEDGLQAGAAGFLAPAVASEVETLSAAERTTLVPYVLGVLRGRAPLIVGCSAGTAAESAHWTATAARAGAQACLIAPPPALRDDADQLLAFLREADSPLPLIVQDLDWTGPGLAVENLLRLRDALPCLAGVKVEAVPAGPKYTRVKRALGAGFHVSGGWAAPQMIEALDRGVDAFIPETSMVRIYNAIWRHHRAGRRAEAVRVFRDLIPVLAFTNQELRLSIAFFKRLLVRKGIFATETMRLPAFAWDEFSERIADELMGVYLQLEGQTSPISG